MTIGQLAKRTDSNAPTIRYYEEIGLLPKASRKASGHRTYSDADLKRLTLIRRCRDFGFSIEQIRLLVGLTEAPDGKCTEVRDLALTHLNTVREKRRALQELEQSLLGFVQDCQTDCEDGRSEERRVGQEFGSTWRFRWSPFH